MTFLLWSFDLGLSNLLWLVDVDAYGVQFRLKRLIFFSGVGWLAGLAEINYFYVVEFWFRFVKFVMTCRCGRLWGTILAQAASFNSGVGWLAGLAEINDFLLLWSFDLGLSNLLWLSDVDAYGVQFRLEWLIFFNGVYWLAGSAVINDFLLLWSFDFGLSNLLWFAEVDAYGV